MGKPRRKSGGSPRRGRNPYKGNRNVMDELRANRRRLERGEFSTPIIDSYREEVRDYRAKSLGASAIGDTQGVRHYAAMVTRRLENLKSEINKVVGRIMNDW